LDEAGRLAAGERLPRMHHTERSKSALKIPKPNQKRKTCEKNAGFFDLFANFY